jgi:hypothetical protein
MNAANAPRPASRFSRFRNSARGFAGRASVGATTAYAAAKVAAKDPKYYIVGAVVFLVIAAGVFFFGFSDTITEKERGDRKTVVTFFITAGLALLAIAFLTSKCIAMPSG